MPVSISPNFSASKLDSPSIDDVVDVYEDRISNWVLGPAKSLLSIPHGEPSSFCLLLTYFEGAWSYKVSTPSINRSKEFFALCFVDVFKNGGVSERVLQRLAHALYLDARCGFFHDGLFRERVYFASMNRDIVVTLPKRNGALDFEGEIQSILIDPARCGVAVERHFAAYIAQLRDSTNESERVSFFAFFKSQCDWESPGPIIAIPEPRNPTTRKTG